MIKSNVTVIGTVTRSADIKEGRDGNAFITFGMKVHLQDGDQSADLDLSVAYDGEDEDVLFSNKGDRVKVEGVMTFKKMDDTTYFNLSAKKVKKVGEAAEYAPVPGHAGIQGRHPAPGQERGVPHLRCLQCREGRRGPVLLHLGAFPGLRG